MFLIANKMRFIKRRAILLLVLDASAKIPSGLLRGNVNQLGDYDQCLGVLAHVKVDERTIRIQGKYCLAAMDLHASHPDMRLPVNLMQGRAFIRASMHDVRNLVEITEISYERLLLCLHFFFTKCPARLKNRIVLIYIIIL